MDRRVYEEIMRRFRGGSALPSQNEGLSNDEIMRRFRGQSTLSPLLNYDNDQVDENGLPIFMFTNNRFETIKPPTVEVPRLAQLNATGGNRLWTVDPNSRGQLPPKRKFDIPNFNPVNPVIPDLPKGPSTREPMVKTETRRLRNFSPDRLKQIEEKERANPKGWIEDARDQGENFGDIFGSLSGISTKPIKERPPMSPEEEELEMNRMEAKNKGKVIRHRDQYHFSGENYPAWKIIPDTLEDLANDAADKVKERYNFGNRLLNITNKGLGYIYNDRKDKLPKFASKLNALIGNDEEFNREFRKEYGKNFSRTLGETLRRHITGEAPDPNRAVTGPKYEEGQGLGETTKAALEQYLEELESFNKYGVITPERYKALKEKVRAGLSEYEKGKTGFYKWNTEDDFDEPEDEFSKYRKKREKRIVRTDPQNLTGYLGKVFSYGRRRQNRDEFNFENIGQDIKDLGSSISEKAKKAYDYFKDFSAPKLEKGKELWDKGYNKGTEKAKELWNKGYDYLKNIYGENDIGGYAPLTKSQVETAREAIKDMNNPETKAMSPLRRAFHQYILDNYGSGYEDTPEGRAGRSASARRYDKYYSPFLIGFDRANPENIPLAKQKEINYWDMPHERYAKTKYNKKMTSLSRGDALINALSSAGGSVLGASGGLPGVIAGGALSQGMPLIWDALKRWRSSAAKRNARSAYNNRQVRNHYRSIF